MFVYLTKAIEFELLINLTREFITKENVIGIDSIYIQDYTFFDYSNNHILNIYYYNSDYFVDIQDRIPKYQISFNDMAKWYYYTKKGSSGGAPLNFGGYYCSALTGPTCMLARKAAMLNSGQSITQELENGVIVEITKKNKSSLLYKEYFNGYQLPINMNAGEITWDILYDPKWWE